ncbi:hypothetical protein AJ87_33820 [Rhizobium yanglingense]|nr:hypothetical protein AJ87_33820 [Rhizobium yanglingense]
MYRREIKLFRAPLQDPDIVELVRFYPLRQFLIERLHLACYPECTVTHVAAGTSGNLAEFGRIEIAELIAVELAVLRERHVIDIEIEAHADRIGCDEISTSPA